MAEKFSEDVILKDGSSLRVRPIRPDDRDRLRGFFNRMSPRTRYLRFHYTKEHLSEEELDFFTKVSPPASNAIVGTVVSGGGEQIVGVSRWYKGPDPENAEVIVVVEDAYQFRGIGTALLDRLAVVAIGYGIKGFVGVILPENSDMIEVFEKSGFRTTCRLAEGVYHVTVDLGEKEEFDQKRLHREHVARSQAVRNMLYPRSVAVVGASRRPESVGGSVFRNMLSSDFSGPVFPVNPKASSIGGVLAYPSVVDVPGDVDLAVIVVPAKGVPEVVDQCARKGVRSMVIITAGFGEIGGEGKALEDELGEKVRGYGIRLIGPNCLGIMNTDPESRLNATFSPIAPPRGKISIGTQSGALGLALIDYARTLDLGIANFVSIGNRLDISSNDLLEYWEDDPNTDIVLLYQESFGNPSRFSRIARRVSRKKPIIAVKAGKSAVGARAASSHTGALAASDVAVEAMFRQAGVIRVSTLQEMFNLTRAMAYQPVPGGGRVGILTNAGGPGVLAADAAEGWGLTVPQLSEQTVQGMRGFLPGSASVGNPVDMIASASPDDYARCLALMLDDPGIDAVVVIYIPPLVTRPEDVASALRKVLEEKGGEKPVFACFMMLERKTVDISVSEGLRIPMFTFPEDAIQALARARQYQRYRDLDEGVVPEFPDIDKDAARQALFEGRGYGGGGWLMPEDAFGLLGRYGIQVPDFRVAHSPDGAEAAASELGYPVAMKLRSAVSVHKTDVGGVALDLTDARAVKEAFERMAASGAGGGQGFDGVVLQPMVRGGTEVVMGMSKDPVFGPLVMLGLGGIHVELMKDVAFSLHPLTDLDPDRMLGQLRGLPLLEGWRNAPHGDTGKLKEMLLRFSALVEDFPEIEEMEINPLTVMKKGSGCVVLDVRARVRPAGADD